MTGARRRDRPDPGLGRVQATREAGRLAGRGLAELLAAAALALACLAPGPAARPASAAASDQPASIEDPEILSAVSEVEEANLDNAMASAGKEADKSIGHILALLASARLQAAESLRLIKGLPKPPPPEDEDEAAAEEDPVELLGLSLQVLQAKTDAFKVKAASASVSLPGLDDERLASRRRLYRPKDRERDLRKQEAYLRSAAARVPAALSAVQAEFMGSVRDLLSELKAARDAVGKGTELAAAGRKGSRRFDAGFEELQERSAQLDSDIVDFERELRLVEACLGLVAADLASFEPGARKRR